MTLTPITFIGAIHPKNPEVVGHFDLDNPFLQQLRYEGFKLGQDFVSDEERGLFFGRGKCASLVFMWLRECPNWKATRIDFTIYFPGQDYWQLIGSMVDKAKENHPRTRPMIMESFTRWGGKNAELTFIVNNMHRKGMSVDIRVRGQWLEKLWQALVTENASFSTFMSFYRGVELFLFGEEPFIPAMFG